LGLIPEFLDDDDPRPARDQIDGNYAHGGGWQPMVGFEMDDEQSAFLYPGDPPLRPFAMTMLRDEVILFLPYSFIAIVQPDNSFEISRVD
jgi:hypothetical protein